MELPNFDGLMNPLLRAIRELGGSGTVAEICDKVVELEEIAEDAASQLHDPGKSNETKLAYRLAWVRTYLKKYGLLENSKRGVWALTAKATEFERVDPKEVNEFNRTPDEPPPDPPDENEEWRETLHHILTKKIEPAAFERLTQRLLRESGFVQVEVTGRSGDGGIDGKGIARIHEFMSFRVFFQCKRYQGSVSAGAIRDFRGAMVGRADKGLFITTGTFTAAAVKEATRDGASPIDLVDGRDLAEKLKKLSLGIKTKMKTTVDQSWFESV